MPTLALEFSSSRRSVCVLTGGGISEAIHEGTRSTPIFPLIAKALDAAGIHRGEVNRIAIGIGPGSYTGVRLAISVAQGWSLARPVECVAVSSFEALAISARETGFTTATLAADAQRGEMAIARVTFDGENYNWHEPIRLVKISELKSRLADGESIAGPDVIELLGGGVSLYPYAKSIAILGAKQSTLAAPENLAPIYLREASFVKAPPTRSIPGITTDVPQ